MHNDGGTDDPGEGEDAGLQELDQRDIMAKNERRGWKWEYIRILSLGSRLKKAGRVTGNTAPPPLTAVNICCGSLRWKNMTAGSGSLTRCAKSQHLPSLWPSRWSLGSAEEYIPGLPAENQYSYGLDAGRILAKLHTIHAPADAPAWGPHFHAKIDRNIAMYEACLLKYENANPFLTYIEENRHLLADRPQSYQHGDYHVGNMMVDKQGKLTVIDFDRDDFGDPWEEFNRIVWCAHTAPAFASGMVDGYFDGQVPVEFWKLLALYICSNTLSSLPWAIPFGEGEIQIMRDQAAQILRWYDDMKNIVPAWYKSMYRW